VNLLEKLPKEILWILLEKLDFDSICMMSLLSKYWYNISTSEEFWKKMVTVHCARYLYKPLHHQNSVKEEVSSYRHLYIRWTYHTKKASEFTSGNCGASWDEFLQYLSTKTNPVIIAYLFPNDNTKIPILISWKSNNKLAIDMYSSVQTIVRNFPRTFVELTANCIEDLDFGKVCSIIKFRQPTSVNK